MVLCLIIMAAVIAVDQLSKIAATAYLAGEASVTLVPHVMDLTYLENRGAAFGMLAEHRWVFMVLSVLLIGALVAYLAVVKPTERLQRVAIALIAGGGIGNMIDRVVRGFVVDFLEITLFDFYVFNIADSAVCIGCALLLISVFLSERKNLKEKKREN